MEITQDDYKKQGKMQFPNRTSAVFTSPKQTINIYLNYTKVKFNEPQEMDFYIPEKYTPYQKPNKNDTKQKE